MMNHADLKEELKARGEPRSGLTAKLQHHLYALLVHAAVGAATVPRSAAVRNASRRAAP